MYCHCYVTQLCLLLCEGMNCTKPGLPVPHHLPKFAQVHVHCICDAIQPAHRLSSPSPSAFNLSQHQGLFQWVGCLHKLTKKTGASASASGFPVNIQGWVPLRLTGLISSDGQKLDAFDLWYWRRLLKIFWTARRSNQSMHVCVVC